MTFSSYQLAENIDGQLKRMVSDLKEIIDYLNASNDSQDSDSPVSIKILTCTTFMDFFLDFVYCCFFQDQQSCAMEAGLSCLLSFYV